MKILITCCEKRSSSPVFKKWAPSIAPTVLINQIKICYIMQYIISLVKQCLTQKTSKSHKHFDLQTQIILYTFSFQKDEQAPWKELISLIFSTLFNSIRSIKLNKQEVYYFNQLLSTTFKLEILTISKKSKNKVQISDAWYYYIISIVLFTVISFQISPFTFEVYWNI